MHHSHFGVFASVLALCKVHTVVKHCLKTLFLLCWDGTLNSNMHVEGATFV